MAVQPRFRDVREAITEGANSFIKWYRKVDHTSDAYFICLGKFDQLLTLATHTFMYKSIVLDPNIKHLYCRARWEREQYEAGMKRLEDVVSLQFLLCDEDVLNFISSSFINTILSRN
jgi:hypothetical protein